MQSLAQEGYEALQTLPASRLGSDAEALSTLEMVTLNSDPARAVALGKRVVELRPQCASCALGLGLAQKQAGDLPEAERQLLRAIDLDPSLMQAYAQLALLYDGQKRVQDAAAIVNRFLKWNPRNIQFRLAHSR
jgi:Flp pilus assembly protein TadD